MLIACPFFVTAQTVPTSGQVEVINKFYEGYNRKDYDEMRKPLSGLMKAFLTKKALKNNYGTTYMVFGKAKVAAIHSLSPSAVSVEVVYEKDPTETDRTQFVFSKKNKIVGMGRKAEKFQYPKPAAVSTVGQNVLKARIDSLVQLKYTDGKFNGNVLVMDKGRVIYKNCMGYSDFEKKIPLNDSSVFELASCSKQFTAMAIMILAERGKLNYTDNVQKYIPDLPYENITIENLLTHTSGLPAYEQILDKYWDKTKFATNADIVSTFKKYKIPVSFKPGKKFEYSNTGYAMLSLVIEKVSGMSYQDFLSENIFSPLGMNHSRVYNTRRVKKEVISNYAYGYVYSDSLGRYLLPDLLPDYNFVVYMDAITGDGTVNSTILDLAAWDKSIREYTLVKQSTMEKAFANHKLSEKENTDYGYGWELQGNDKYQRLAYHSGSWPGHLTFMIHFLDSNKAVIILSNNEYVNISKFAGKIAAMLSASGN